MREIERVTYPAKPKKRRREGTVTKQKEDTKASERCNDTYAKRKRELCSMYVGGRAFTISDIEGEQDGNQVRWQQWYEILALCWIGVHLVENTADKRCYK